MADLLVDTTTNRANHLRHQAHKAVNHHAQSLQRIRREYDPTVPSSKLRIVIGLDAGFAVPLPLLNSVRHQVCEILPFLRAASIYCAKDLVGIDYWHALNGGERRILDQCIERLIYETLPMQAVKPGRNQPASFRFLGLKPSQGVQQ